MTSFDLSACLFVSEFFIRDGCVCVCVCACVCVCVVAYTHLRLRMNGEVWVRVGVGKCVKKEVLV